MINKTMTFFWSGEKLSWLRYMTLYSFRKLNPDWVMELHLSKPIHNLDKKWSTREVQDNFSSISKDSIDKIYDLDINIIEHIPQRHIHPAHNSDLFQWKWLGENSGFYSDMDILFIRSMDDFYDVANKHDIIIAFNKGIFSIGMVGSSGKNRFFKDLYSVALSIIDQKLHHHTYNKTGACAIEVLIKDTKTNPQNLLQIYPEYAVWPFPMHVVYPFSWENDAARFYGVHDLSQDPEVVGIHWYAGSSVSQRFNEILNEDNYTEHDNTICYYINKILEMSPRGGG